MVDWAATGQMLSGIGTITGSLAIVVGAILGRKAVTDFRRQKLAEREIEHAEKALAVSYRLQQAASVIRHPMSTAQEIASSREELEQNQWFCDESDNDKKDRLIQSNVFHQRIRYFKEVYDDAISIMPLVKAYFGEEPAAALQNLVHLRHAVRVYANAYANDYGFDADFSIKIRSFIWEGVEQDDPLASQAKAAINSLERNLLPVIRESARKQKAN